MSYEKHAADLMMKYPKVEDLAAKAQRRLPKVAWAYLVTGTGSENLIDRNIQSFKDVTLAPRFLKGELSPKLETQLFGRSYGFPFGIAPVGLTGLMWPEAEVIMAKSARKYKIPYALSTVATETPETIGPEVGDMGWFQLYAPRDLDLNKKLLDRAQTNGFHTLLITADVPTPSRRERTKRAGLNMPPKITPDLIWQGITHPRWTMATLKRGLPSLRTVNTYAEFKNMMSVGAFVRDRLGGNLSWDMCARIKEMWDGPVIIKGILHPEDAEKAISIGMDGIVVSNHGGRQFDGAPASMEVLPNIAKVVNGRIPIIMDSGVRTGLDILKAMALGADFCLLGRAFLFGVGALDKYGADHVVEILKDELINNMINLGIESLDEL
ncbi:MAG: alpha-hydroxy-acid oxidizing protein [Bacteroidia bacterium]|nr:alpha-hydroxy-acid oxidizing protein [Bacteroidia bacterium]